MLQFQSIYGGMMPRGETRAINPQHIVYESPVGAYCTTLPAIHEECGSRAHQVRVPTEHGYGWVSLMTCNNPNCWLSDD